MKSTKKSSKTFDPNGNYTGKYIVERDGSFVTTDSLPEQDADDL